MWADVVPAIAGLSVALIVVIMIHKVVMRHLGYRSVQKTLLSMEVMAFGFLMAAFSMGEVLKVAKSVAHSDSNEASYFGLEARDVVLVFCSLAASVLIYIAATALVARKRRR